MGRALGVLRKLTRAVGEGRDMDVILGLFEDRLARSQVGLGRAARAPQPAAGGAGAQPGAGRRGRPGPRHRRAPPQPAPAAARRSRRLRDRPRPRPRAAGGGGGRAAAGLQPAWASGTGPRRCTRCGGACGASATPPRSRTWCAARSRGPRCSGSGCRTASASSTTTTSSPAWFEEQARLAEARDNTLLARAARRERRAFIGLGRLLHRALLETKPADLALRALQAMARGRSIAST